MLFDLYTFLNFTQILSSNSVFLCLSGFRIFMKASFFRFCEFILAIGNQFNGNFCQPFSSILITWPQQKLSSFIYIIFCYINSIRLFPNLLIRCMLVTQENIYFYSLKFSLPQLCYFAGLQLPAHFYVYISIDFTTLIIILHVNSFDLAG